MISRILGILAGLALPLSGLAQQTAKDTIHLYFLGGQSNMEGYGYTKDLPDSLDTNFENVYIFEGNPTDDEQPLGGQGVWEPLQPGHGTGFKSDGTTNTHSNRFGIELSFAKKLQQYYPDQKIALVKYAKGGSSIDSLAAGRFGAWDPHYNGKNGINQYDHFLATLNNALTTKDLDGNGREDYLVPMGILWMQGESDGDKTEAIAQKYYQNLSQLMNLIRASLRTDDLPVVVGKISDSWNAPDGKVWDYGELVQYAQEKFAREDGNAAIIRSTRYYKYSDPWHYDSAGYIHFGEQFADAVYRLNE
ncbi:sialate O-acetylesterase [Leeuwenhoekiella parthenopeia]|uniref:Sialate O-acetylesterase n=1 Tax=Leeuwenhoekiella parthenopeia TaxID=2890320 RepID=A0ABS8GVK2_9FLAO|nr:sialate O-acetylesterase [Leeuwenhoekiella parthenopeia]MCC4214037.1 sialate O-acetylesterase [Leeuwenhoekiella parthenopeia]